MHFFMERYTQAYLDEMKAFIEAVVQDKDPEVTGQDGRVPVVMAYGAQRSLETGRPVRLAEVMATP